MFIDLEILNNSGYSDLLDFVTVVMNLAISMSVLVAVVSIIISGFKFIFSMGNDKKIKEATSALMYSLIGLVLVFIAPKVIEFVITEILK